MAALSTKVKNSLDEARILVLGTQVMLGFQYRAFMEPGFEKLPPPGKTLKLAGLCLLLVAFGLLLAPAARHRLVERGWDSSKLVRFAGNAVRCALVPFAAALGLDFYFAGERVFGRTPGIAAALAATLCALALWFVAPLAMRRSHPEIDEEELMSQPKLEQRIQQVLTEARVVLPGAQALLGFQLAMMLMDAYEKLSATARSIHFLSLCCVALTTVMLMAPPAFHRIAERGEDTERLERFSGAMVLCSLFFLACGLSLDLAVVTERWNGSLQVGAALGAACLALLLSGWFGLALVLRNRRSGR